MDEPESANLADDPVNSGVPVSDCAMESSASGDNEFVFDHGFFADGEEATCTARELASRAVIGGRGSTDGNGVLRACLISRELAMR